MEIFLITLLQISHLTSTGTCSSRRPSGEGSVPVPFWAEQFFFGSHLIWLSPFLLHFSVGLKIVPTLSCVISFFLSRGCHYLVCLS